MTATASKSPGLALDRRARVVIVDDHPLVREGLVARLSSQPDLEVCGEADGVDTARRMIEATRPDLALVDLSLRDGSGLELIRRLRSEGPKPLVLVVTAHEEALYAERALQAGAQGYIEKHEAPARILSAVRTVLRGELHVPPTLSRRLLQPPRGAARAKSGIDALSNRELQVFTLIGKGHGTREIAELLRLSPHTIESHRERIRDKLDLRNAAELMQRAVRFTLEQAGGTGAPDRDRS